MPPTAAISFPGADSNLTRQVYRDLPNVDRHVGRSGHGHARARPASTSTSARLWTPPRPRASSPPRARARAGSAAARQVTINPSNGQGVAVPDVAGKQLNQAVSELRAAGFGNVQPGTCTEDATAGIQGKVIGHEPAGGHGREPNAAITVALQPHQVRLVAADSGQDRPHRARSGGGGRRGRRDLGHRHRALPVHGSRARGAHPPDGHRSPPGSAPLRRPHGAVAAPQAAVDGRAGRAVATRPRRQHGRQPRARATGCAASASRSTRSAASPVSSCTGRTTTPRPSPRNPLRYFTGPSKREDRERTAGHRRRSTAYLGDELGWLDLNNTVGSLEVAGLRVDAFGVSDAHRDWDRLEVLPDLLRRARAPTSHPPTLTIGVTHAPYRRVLDSFVDLGADMIFAGHTHGGQVRLPGLRRARRQLRHPAEAGARPERLDARGADACRSTSARASGTRSTPRCASRAAPRHR